jgi:hypothetical protein
LIIAVIAAVAAVGVPVCGLTGMCVGFEMVHKVNKLLPAEQQFEPFGWYYSKYQRLTYEYRRLYPDGNLLRRSRVISLVMVACLLVSCWGFWSLSR